MNLRVCLWVFNAGDSGASRGLEDSLVLILLAAGHRLRG